MAEKEVLTQDEVDTLLDGVDKGGVDTTTQQDDGEIQAVDFASQERVIRSQFPVLTRIYERTARKLNVSIYDQLSRDVEVTAEDMKIFKYGEFMNTLKMPSGINIVRVHPLKGKALMVFDSDLVYTLVEGFFGGDGRFKSEMEEREYTATELRITDLILKIIIRDLESAWKPIMPVNFEVLSNEMNPQMANITAATDVMVVSPFNFQFQNSSGQINVVLPYSMLEPIREHLDVGSGSSDDEIDPNWVNSLEQELLDAPLELSAMLADAQLSLRDIINIKADDVIPIEIPEIITLSVEGIPTFRVKYGVSRHKCALKIVDKIDR